MKRYTRKPNPWNRRRNLFSAPVPKDVKEPKVKWKVLPILWMALVRTCTLLGAVLLVSAVITAWSFSYVAKDMNVNMSLPDQMVLYLELDGDLGELPKDVSLTDPFGSGGGQTLKAFIGALERAKTDPRVKGLYARINAGGYSLAHIQEMRDAIFDFRESGKFAYIYAPSFDYGLGAYYLASSFDEIWLQPMGTLMITGVNAELPFLRGVLDKIGIQPQFFQRKKFKNAYESLTNSEMSEANRLAMETLIDDLTDVIANDLSDELEIEKSAFKRLVDKGLFLG